LQDTIKNEEPLSLNFEASMSLVSLEVSMSFEFPSTDHHVLIGTSWTAVDTALDGKIIENPITIEFDSDNRVLGSAGCNHYRGDVELSDGTLTIGGGFQTTRRYCPGLMDQERAYLGTLKNATILYDIINAGENGNDNNELVLYESVPGVQGEGATRGERLFRFVKDEEVK
jgi:heat shock protein HslJ